LYKAWLHRYSFLPGNSPFDNLFFGQATLLPRIHWHFLHLKSGKQSDETVLAITGLNARPEVQGNGEALLEIARGQWSIENGNHYVRSSFV